MQNYEKILMLNQFFYRNEFFISVHKIYEINALSLKRFNIKDNLSISNILKYDKIVKDWVYDTYKKEETE